MLNDIFYCIWVLVLGFPILALFFVTPIFLIIKMIRNLKKK